jgi:hypothetical protein
MSRTTAVAAAAILIVTPAVFAQNMPPTFPTVNQDEEAFSGVFHALASSQYIWRGYEFNPDAVFQPALRLNEKGVELAGQGTIDFTDANGMKGDLSDWKLRAGLARRMPGSEVALTYNYYGYRGERNKTQEIALEMAWGNPFFMGLDVYWDIDRTDGFYGRLSTGFGWKTGFLSLIPSISVGAATDKYLDYYFGVDNNSFCDLQATLRAEAELTAGVSIVAQGDYSEMLTGDLREARNTSARGEKFWWGGGVSLRF